MARITVEDCIDKFPSRFELVLVASQRSRKLFAGEAPTVEKDNDKNTVIALREIADSTLTIDELKENLIQEYQTVTINDEEEENIEIESKDEKNNESEVDLKKTDEIEKEMNELVSSEDESLKEQYVVSDDFESTNSSNENEEVSNKEDEEVSNKEDEEVSDKEDEKVSDI